MIGDLICVPVTTYFLDALNVKPKKKDVARELIPKLANLPVGIPIRLRVKDTPQNRDWTARLHVNKTIQYLAIRVRSRIVRVNSEVIYVDIWRTQ